MNRLWNRFFKPTVPIVRIEAPYVDSLTTAKVISRLSKINAKKAKGVAVYIDVNGGSLTQSEIIRDKIQEFCRINKLPLYTFAGTQATGAGYYLLSMGNKIFTSEISQIGGVGIQQTFLDVEPILKRMGIEDRFLKTKEFLYSEALLSHKLSEKDVKTLQDIQSKRYSNFVKSVNKSNDHRTKNGAIVDVLNQAPLGIYFGSEAVSKGIADGLGTLETVLRREFPNARGEEYLPKSPLELARKFFVKTYDIANNKWIPIIFVTYFIVSTIVEVWLAYVAAKYAKDSGKKSDEEPGKSTK